MAMLSILSAVSVVSLLVSPQHLTELFLIKVIENLSNNYK